MLAKNDPQKCKL